MLLRTRIREGVSYALQEHQSIDEKANSKYPVGNLSYCIFEGFKNAAFNLTKKIDKLEKKDGILWKNDLCLRPDCLVQFVRCQSGYQDWSSNRITRTLKDINALVVQEDAAATVHLKKGTPRVYRIRLATLEENAIRY